LLHKDAQALPTCVNSGMIAQGMFLYSPEHFLLHSITCSKRSTKMAFNLGPLTTAVSFPSSCGEHFYDMRTTYLGINGFTLPTAGFELSQCRPSGIVYTHEWAWYSSYFSPGVCPLGYNRCAAPQTLSSVSGETIALCCPEGMLSESTDSAGHVD
jgi:hypothetical protein